MMKKESLPADCRNVGGNFRRLWRVPDDGPAVNDDAQLIDETLAGHTAAFGRLVLKYQDRLYNTVVHVAGNAEDARDVVQEAFVQAFLKLDTFQHSSAFYTWLYRIAFNVAASHRRRRRPTLSVEYARETSGLEPIDDGNGPTERLEQNDRCQQVRQALERLSEEHRTVLVLREIDGCCYETIADVLDLPIGTVRSRLHRARLQLREQLKEVLMIDE
jgi:RNA polymerase sigma-70 factor (ECF subfamily)